MRSFSQAKSSARSGTKRQSVEASLAKSLKAGIAGLGAVLGGAAVVGSAADMLAVMNPIRQKQAKRGMAEIRSLVEEMKRGEQALLTEVMSLRIYSGDLSRSLPFTMEGAIARCERPAKRKRDPPDMKGDGHSVPSQEGRLVTILATARTGIRADRWR